MVYSQTFLANAHIYPKVPYGTLNDFIGIASLTRLVGMRAVHPSLLVRTAKDFIALAKVRPGDVLYGSGGGVGFRHFSMSVFASMTGVKTIHVPFKGGAPTVVAMMGGEVQAILTPIAELYPQLKSGRVRPIAESSEKRTLQFPEIPAIAETVKGYESTSWFGAFAPAGMPKPIIDSLQRVVKLSGVRLE